MGRSSEAKNRKNPKKVKCDGRTDGRTDGPTKRGVESRSTRLKRKHVSGIQLEAGLLEWSSTVIKDSLEGFSLFRCELATL